MAEDLASQVQSLGRGLVQVNLRLARVLEAVERTRSADAGLDPLLDLLEAVDRTLATSRVPARVAWWHRFVPPPPTVDLSGLAVARAEVVARLAAAGVEPIAEEGPCDPRLHVVVDTVSAEPPLHGTIARVHRRGWVRRGDPPDVVRPAHVTAHARPS